MIWSVCSKVLWSDPVDNTRRCAISRVLFARSEAFFDSPPKLKSYAANLFRQRAFQFQQFSLHLEPAAVAAQRAVGCDHAMARDHDRDRLRLFAMPTARNAFGLPTARAIAA